MIMILFLFVCSVLSIKSNMKVLQDKSSEPSTISCVGNAGNSLISNRVKIEFSIKSKKYSAIEALADNIKDSQAVKNALISLGVNAENDLQTTSFTVTPQYRSVFNTVTQSYDSIFDGYEVMNSFQLTSLKKELSGKLIEQAVKAGASINSISFDVTEEIVKKAKMDLIKPAIDDCNKQFKNTLDPIKYKAGDFISINIHDMQQSSPHIISFEAFRSADSTPIFPKKIIISIQIDIKVKINK